ncbi:DNA-directed RNA polymerase II largest subunit-related protein [Reticulomyxa filosa]|uniref:DNA-directed RNA polymerase II largest subunit-related protein n=1 Tax=Reticulomyxa filosa TaxID=46433 RepID=X6NHM7_RETFI|nr:DNA-directed RNA polymerase II largest subunit-related protein [Reticulomyxa filosa]|eukprot:ETO25368.1 DNA-directed RNA polymerase II largest subunit-related protein [Reticulomyxa filosa]
MSILVTVRDSQGFMDGEIYASFFTDVSLSCNASDACLLSNLYTSNAESLQVACDALPESAGQLEAFSCAQSVIYCPVNAWLLSLPERCLIDCGTNGENCLSTTVFHAGGLNAMDLACDEITQSCNGITIFCGKGLETSCKMSLRSNTYVCDACNLDWTSSLPNVTNENYFIAEYAHKYGFKNISCDNAWGGNECYIIAGTTNDIQKPTPDGRGAIIYSNAMKRMFLYGHSRGVFTSVIIDATMVEELSLFSYHKSATFRSMTLFAPYKKLTMHCDTPGSCLGSLIESKSSQHVDSNLDIWISCGNEYACENTLWNFKETTGSVHVECHSHEAACSKLRLYIPELNQTQALVGVIPNNITCFSNSSLSIPSCYNASVYATRGTQDIQISCWTTEDGSNARSSLSGFACTDLNFYCTPLFEFGCILQADNISTLGYDCDSQLCTNYSTSLYRQFAPTSSPSFSPSRTPSRVPTQFPTPPTNAPTRSPTISPTNAPTFSPTRTPSRAPTYHPTPAPTFRAMQVCNNADETGTCRFNCTGDFACLRNLLVCQSLRCDLTCQGRSACEGAELDVSYQYTQTMSVWLNGYRSGAFLQVMGYDLDFADSYVLRYTPLSIYVNAQTSESFMNGEIFVGHNSSASIYCKDSYSCALARFAASNADSLYVNCTDSDGKNDTSYSCLNAAVFCPVSALLDRKPWLCSVDCTSTEFACRGMSIFHIGSIDEMDLSCDPRFGTCDALKFHCGLGLNTSCTVVSDSGMQGYDCSLCTYNTTYIPPINNLNYFITDYPNKYRRKRIHCHSNCRYCQDECIIISGINSFVESTSSDAKKVRIMANEHIAAITLHGFSTAAFQRAVISAGHVERLQMFSYRKIKTYHRTTIYAPMSSLEMYCNTPEACAESVIETFEDYNDTTIFISCNNRHACAKGMWALDYAFRANIECGHITSRADRPQSMHRS